MPKNPDTHKKDNDQKVSKPHDSFFKKVMNNPLAAAEFFQEHVPAAIAEKIDPGSLVLMDSSFIQHDFRETRTDLVYSATFSGAPGYIYIHIEHQRAPDRLMPLRIFEYKLQIIRKDLEKNASDGPLPLVYSCVIYNGEKPYCYTTDFFELFQDPELARESFLKPFPLVDLPGIPDEDLKKRPLLGLMEMLLKHTRTRNTIALIKNIADLLQQADSMNQIDIINAVAYYLFQTNRDGTARHTIVQEFQKHLIPSTQDNVMTIAEAFIEEGVQKGLQTGRQEGEATLLARQLKRRFGIEAVEQYLFLINEADSEQLSQWGENFVDAKNIEDVFCWQG